MAYVLNAITAPDSYTPLATIQGPLFQRFVIDVINQPIFWEIQSMVGASGVWEENAETYMLPGSRVILEPARGIRVRAAIPAGQIPAGQAQASVTIRAIT